MSVQGVVLLLKPQRGGTIMFFQTAESCNPFEKWELYATRVTKAGDTHPPISAPFPLILTAVCGRRTRIRWELGEGRNVDNKTLSTR